MFTKECCGLALFANLCGCYRCSTQWSKTYAYFQCIKLHWSSDDVAVVEAASVIGDGVKTMDDL